MTATPESIEVKLTRLEGKFDALADKVDDKGETDRLIRVEIQQVREQARHDSSAVRVDLERQITLLAAHLGKHEQAVNPHPNQEDWLRRHLDRVVVSIEALRDSVAQAKGAGRVLWPLLAGAFAGVGGLIAGRLIGG